MTQQKISKKAKTIKYEQYAERAEAKVVHVEARNLDRQFERELGEEEASQNEHSLVDRRH